MRHTLSAETVRAVSDWPRSRLIGTMRTFGHLDTFGDGFARWSHDELVVAVLDGMREARTAGR
jgi:hypothetical protein